MNRHSAGKTVVKACFLAVLLGWLQGCSSPDFPLAEVSGVVTLNGEPLEGARVVFQPRSSGKSSLAGAPSYGETDANGHYRLETIDGYQGAVVAEHRVMISTQRKQADPAGTTKVIVLAEERLPEKYHNKSELTCTVPPTGNTECNFDLRSGE